MDLSRRSALSETEIKTLGKTKNIKKYIDHYCDIFGSKPKKGTVTEQLLLSLPGKKRSFETLDSYEQFINDPVMIVFLGNESTPYALTKDEVSEQQAHISQWLDICIESDNRYSSTICFVAITESMNYENQIKATQLVNFILIPPSLGYYECNSNLTNFFVCHCEACIKIEAVNIVIIDDSSIYNSAFDEKVLPKINVIQVTDVSTIVDDPSVVNADLIALNLSKENCNTTALIRLINKNLHLSRKPLLLYGAEHARKLLIENQLDYDRFLSEPFEGTEFHSVIYMLLMKAKSSLEVAQQLKLSQQAQKHLTLALNSHSLVSKTDSRGIITYANEKFCQTSQYSLQELVGNTHALINSGCHDKAFFSNMWQTISAGKVWNGLVCNKRKDGEYYWVNSTIYPIPIAPSFSIPFRMFEEENSDTFTITNQEKYTYLSIRTEVTDMLINEERLNRSQIFANIGTWDWNIRTGDFFWSDRIGYLFGYGKDIPDLKYEAFINSIHPEDREFVTNSISSCIKKNAEYDIEHRVIWPDGEVRWMREKGDAVRDESGKATHMLGVVQDITQKKEVEFELKKARIAAENANTAKSKFLASMSHELRTPMNAIIGFTQLLQMDKKYPPNADQLDNIIEILNAGKHLLQLIDEVLNLSEIESGNINIFIRSVELGHIIKESVMLLHPSISKNQINLKLFFENSPITESQLDKLQLNVRADDIRIKQILLNLLTNACKYNHVGGTVEISVRVDNYLVIVDIKDTGIGIKKENQKSIFTPFNRLGAEQSEVEGTGIGLVITKQLVELMGGNIGFCSAHGCGTHFWFTIPLENRCNDVQKKIKNSRNDLKAISTSDNKLVSIKSILYVEDNPANLRLVEQIIARLPDVKLFPANNAEKGIEIAAQIVPDLILMDINLPGMNGFQAMKFLKMQPETKNIPIVAISANAMPDYVQEALDGGFDCYITKPIDVSHLMMEVDRLINT